MNNFSSDLEEMFPSDIVSLILSYGPCHSMEVLEEFPEKVILQACRYILPMNTTYVEWYEEALFILSLDKDEFSQLDTIEMAKYGYRSLVDFLLKREERKSPFFYKITEHCVHVILSHR